MRIMFKFKSLTAKFIFISSIMLTFLSAFVFASYLFTHHIKGEAEKINLAGQLRCRSFEMAWLAHRIIQTKDISLITELEHEMNIFEK